MSWKSYVPNLSSRVSKLTGKKYYNFDVKVTIIGNSSVGKTSMVTRITRDTFLDHNHSTIGAAYCTFSRKITTSEDIGIVEVEKINKNYVFKMWDTAGQERFKSLVPMYLKNSDITLIVFDITDSNSFESVGRWYKTANIIAPNAIKILIGSKLDLEKSRQILTYDANQFASYHNMEYIECSSKECINIDKITDFIINTGVQIYEHELFEEDTKDEVIRIGVNEGWGERIQSNCAYGDICNN